MPEPLADGWLDAVSSALEGVTVSDALDGSAVVTVSGAPAGSVAVLQAVVSAGRVTVSSGRHPQPDVVLGWSYEDILAAWRGDLSLESAYMSGRMRVEGDQVLLFDGWRPLLRSSALRSAVESLRGR